MKRIWLRRISLCLAVMVEFSVVCAAQDIPDIGAGSFSIIRESAQFPEFPEPEGVGLAVEGVDVGRNPLSIQLIPLGVRTEGAYVGGGTLGFSRRVGKIPAQVRFGYTHIFPEAGKGLNKLSGTAKASIVPGRVLVPGAEATTTVTAVANYGRVFDQSRRYDLLLSVEQGLLRKDRIVLGVNIGYSNNKPDGVGISDDLTTAFGVRVNPLAGLYVSADYSFENDVDSEDNYALTAVYVFQQQLKFPVSLIFGVGKHQTVVFSMVATLKKR